MQDFASCIRRALHKALNCVFVLSWGLTTASIFDGEHTVVAFLRKLIPELLKRSRGALLSPSPS